MRHHTITRTLSVLMMAGALSLWLTPTAHAQVGGVIDGIGDAVGGGGGDSGGGGSDSGGDGGLIGGIADGLEGDSSGTGGDEPEGSNGGSDGGLVGGIVDAIDDGLENGKETVDDTVDGTTGGGVVGGVVGGVKDTVDRVTNDLTGSGGKKKTNKGKPSGRKDGSRPTSPIYDPSEVLGGSFADALRTDAKILATAKAEGRDYAATGVPATDIGQSVVSQIGAVASQALDQAAFPIALIIMVLAFLMVQNRIDSRDPKLALAPVDSEHDLLSFT